MSDVILGAFVGFTVAVALLCVAGWGMDGKRRAIAEDCKVIGVFVSDGVVYDCIPRTGAN
jgi:hypothetical protein